MDDRAVRFYNRATILFALLAVVAPRSGWCWSFAIDAPGRSGLPGHRRTVARHRRLGDRSIRGLDRDRPWAVPATVVACWLLIVTRGRAKWSTTSTHSTITFPLAAIGAVIVLLADPAAG